MTVKVAGSYRDPTLRWFMERFGQYRVKDMFPAVSPTAEMKGANNKVA